MYSSMTPALEGDELSAGRPDRTLSPGKTRYPLYRRFGWHRGRSGRSEILASTVIRFSDRPARGPSVVIPTELPGSLTFRRALISTWNLSLFEYNVTGYVLQVTFDHTVIFVIV
jgi:hypothetical protein